MAWNPGSNQQEAPQTNAEFYVFNTLFKLRDAEAQGNIEETWVFMRHALQMLMAYLHTDEKQILSKGLNEAFEALAEAEKEESEAAKKARAKPIKKAFIEQHMYYIYLALPRARMIKVEREGELPLDKYDLELMSKLIRTNNAPTTKMGQLAEKGEVKEVEGNAK